MNNEEKEMKEEEICCKCHTSFTLLSPVRTWGKWQEKYEGKFELNHWGKLGMRWTCCRCDYQWLVEQK